MFWCRPASDVDLESQMDHISDVEISQMGREEKIRISLDLIYLFSQLYRLQDFIQMLTLKPEKHSPRLAMLHHSHLRHDWGLQITRPPYQM